MPSPSLDALTARIEAHRLRLKAALDDVRDPRSLEELRNELLGRKRGIVTQLFEELKSVAAEDKREAGRLVNALKAESQAVLDEIEGRLAAATAAGPGAPAPAFDPTLPGERRPIGAAHPLRLFQREIERIFLDMGFAVEDGPEIETDFYNFGALNFPPNHPARDQWDTLYVTDDLMLRTHTSPVQIRVMEKRKPPIRIINPGKVFRKETPDPTHAAMFFQLEGLLVDEGVTLAHLKGTLEYVLKRLFGEKTKVRFRPSYFPFTEPSAEVDIECLQCGQKDPACRVCGGTGWKEILGSGMVDPQVFKNVNIDPERYSGWAFGMGIDRLAMFSLGIPDIRYFYENDLRFNRQFTLR
jgi:phenylalanyl-tRNA synthetase alpha chain